MKRQKYTILFFLVAFTLISFKARSQKWTLEQCINHALDHNIQIKQTELNAELSNVNAVNSRYDMLPSVNGNAGMNNNFGRSVDPFTNQFINANVISYNFSVSSQVTLFNGFSKMNTYKQAQVNYDKSMQDAEKSKNDVVLAVASAYLQVLMLDENVTRAQLQLKSSQDQFDRIQKQVNAGALPESNLLEIRSQLAGDEYNLVNAENQLSAAQLNLAQLLELDKTSIDIEKPELGIPTQVVETYNEEDLYSTATERMPEVKSAELGVRSAEKGMQISKGSYTPSLSLSAVVFTGTSSTAPNPNFDQYSLSGFYIDTIGVTQVTSEPVVRLNPILVAPDYLFKDQLVDNIRQQISLNLSIPIFNGMSTRMQVQRSKLQHEQAVLTESSVKNQLRKNIQQAHSDYKATARRYTSASNQFELADQNFKNAQIRFEQGLISATDYRTISNTRNATQSDLLNAKYEFVFAQKVLDFYQGKPITL